MKQLKSRSFKATAWSFLDVIGARGVNFLVIMYLARILEPEDFGLIGMIMIFIELSRILIDGGLAGSLIRTQNADESDYATVFFINLFGSVFIYGCCFFSAPYIADFYEQPVLVDILRFYCIGFVISSLSIVQKTKLSKELDFKTQMKVNLPAILLSGIIGIGAASLGFGVWSLVFMYLTKETIVTILFWYFSNWYPRLEFNLKKYKYHFDFGYKLTVSEVISRLGDNLYHIVIGKFFSPASLGFYTRADTTSQFPVFILYNTLNRVTFPVFAIIKNQAGKLKAVYKKLLQQVIFCFAPVMLIGVVLAEPLIVFLFSDKWLLAVPFFQLLCIKGIYTPIHAYNLNILKVYDRTDLILLLQCFNVILVFINIYLTMQYGVYGLLVGQIVIANISFFINTYYSGRYIDYGSLEQIKDLLPTVFLAVITMMAVYWLDTRIFIDFSNFFRLVFGSLSGGLLFLLLAKVVNLSALEFSTELLTQLKGAIGKKRNFSKEPAQ